MKTPPIDYIKRTRAYYLALGYDNPYQWAHHDDVPFQGLSKPLSEMVIALVTTAAPYQPDKGDQGPGAPYNERQNSIGYIASLSARRLICVSRTLP